MQLTTARGIISAGMERAGLLGRAIAQVRAARKQERQNRKAGRVAHRGQRAQWQKRRAVLDTGLALAAEYERIRRAMPADAATWQAREEVCDET